jgi:hypothetical protein
VEELGMEAMFQRSGRPVAGGIPGGRREPIPTKLTRNEQIIHITLWAIQAAPLMIGADMAQLDEWTVDLLTNDEVLDVTMDTLGIAGGPVWKSGRLEVWARPLHDGTRAVGLFNRGSSRTRLRSDSTTSGFRGPNRCGTSGSGKSWELSQTASPRRYPDTERS